MALQAAAAGTRAVLVGAGFLSLSCACSGDAEARRPPTEVTTAVDEGSGAEHALARRVWGLAPGDPLPAPDPAVLAALHGVEQDPEAPPPAAQEPSAQDRATLRARFGSSIVIGSDGTVTKQYFLTGEAGQVFLNLLRDPAADPAQGLPTGPLAIGGPDGKSVLGQMLGEQQVEAFYLPNFEVPEAMQLRDIPGKPPVLTGSPPPAVESPPTDLLLVTAQPDALGAFEGALNLFFANVPQVEIEIKVVEYSTSDTVAFGVQVLDPLMPNAPPTFTQTSSGKLIGNIISQFPLAAPSPTGTEVSDRGIITLGGIHDSWQLNATLEALEVNGIADILSSPRLVVRNGGTASVVTSTDFPYPKAKISASGQNVTADIAFKPVGVTLSIRPVIAGTDTVILQVYAKISAVTSFAATDPVDTPVISTREVVTSVHVSNGNTTVIGGLVTSSTFERTSQVPILGDIPILGYLFRSTSTTTDKTTLEFHITPRVLRGERTYAGE